ncbi:MAG: hypothetical protein AAF657_08190 [Acidobacteriota bacterium]
MLEQISRTKLRWTLALALLMAGLGLSACGSTEASQADGEIAAQLANREAAVAEREATVALRETALNDHDTEIESRLQALEAREQELAQREAALASRQGELATRQAELASRQAALAKSRSDLDRQRSALADSETRLAADRAAVDLEAERQAEVKRRQPPPEVYAEIDLEASTLIDVEFLTTVSSATSRPGDSFRTRLTADLHAGDGRLVVPAGTELTGIVTEAVPLKRVGGQAELGLRFGELQLPWGRPVEINASFYDAGRNESRRDKKVIGRAAAGGAILGAIIDDDDRGRGTVLGAILGAAAGTAASANRPKDEVEIPGGTVVTLELDEPVSVQVPWKSRYAAP